MGEEGEREGGREEGGRREAGRVHGREEWRQKGGKGQGRGRKGEGGKKKGMKCALNMKVKVISQTISTDVNPVLTTSQTSSTSPVARLQVYSQWHGEKPQRRLRPSPGPVWLAWRWRPGGSGGWAALCPAGRLCSTAACSEDRYSYSHTGTFILQYWCTHTLIQSYLHVSMCTNYVLQLNAHIHAHMYVHVHEHIHNMYTFNRTHAHEERLGNIFREPSKTGSYTPGIEPGASDFVSALPLELWPPGEGQPSQFSISLCMCR